MSRITDILDVFVTRLSVITGANIAVKRPRIFNPDETPGLSVYRGPTEHIDHSDEGPALLEMPVTVDYYVTQAGEADPSDRAEIMINAVIAAIETSASTGDGFLDGNLCEPVFVLSDDVLLPDAAGDVIRASVVFSCQFMRAYGGGD